MHSKQPRKELVIADVESCRRYRRHWCYVGQSDAAMRMIGRGICRSKADKQGGGQKFKETLASR